MATQMKRDMKMCPILSIGGQETQCKGLDCEWYHGTAEQGKCAISDMAGYINDLKVMLEEKLTKEK